MIPSFLLLLDTSGSMQSASGEKIQSLNLTVNNFIAGLKSTSEELQLAIITIGGTPSMYNFVPVKEIMPVNYPAKGSTALTEALVLANTTIENHLLKKQSQCSKVITVLISDGIFNDGKFSKITLDGPVYAIGIGFDANYEELTRFTACPSRILRPYDAEAAAGYMLQKN